MENKKGCKKTLTQSSHLLGARVFFFSRCTIPFLNDRNSCNQGFCTIDHHNIKPFQLKRETIQKLLVHANTYKAMTKMKVIEKMYFIYLNKWL